MYEELIEKLREIDVIGFAYVSHGVNVDCGEVADAIEKLVNELEKVKRERDVAIKFIKYIDQNYSSYMTEDEKFEGWRE